MPEIIQNITEICESKETSKKEDYTLQFFNRRTRIQKLKNEETTIYYFDYTRDSPNGEISDLNKHKEIIDAEVLSYLVKNLR